MLQEALAKLIDFRIFLFSLSFLLKEGMFEQFLMSSGRRFQDRAALCLKEDLPTSVLGL